MGFEDFNNEATETSEGGNFVLDLSGVDEKAGGFECLPKGKYEAVVDDVEFGTSKAGAPMLTWKFQLTDVEPKRKMFFYNVLNKPFGISALKKTLVNLGVEVDMGSFNPQTFADQGEAIGMPIQLDLGIQKYEGENRNTVKDTLASSIGNDFI